MCFFPPIYQKKKTFFQNKKNPGEQLLTFLWLLMETPRRRLRPWCFFLPPPGTQQLQTCDEGQLRHQAVGVLGRKPLTNSAYGFTDILVNIFSYRIFFQLVNLYTWHISFIYTFYIFGFCIIYIYIYSTVALFFFTLGHWFGRNTSTCPGFNQSQGAPAKRISFIAFSSWLPS